MNSVVKMDALTLAKLTKLLLIVTTLSLNTRAQNNQCGSIGNSNESVLSVQTERRFYLNTANPTPCNGNITSWRVCYYGPSSVDQDELISYSSTYAVYRRMGSGEDEQYERVSGTLRAVVSTSELADRDPSRSTTDIIVQQGGFTCYNDTNDIDTPIPVQTGDLVGACIFDPEDGVGFFNRFTRLQLDNVGTVDGESLMEMSDSGCAVDTLPSSVQTSDLSTSNNRRLHIYANIVSNEISTTQPSTTLSTTNVEGTSTNMDLTTGNPLSTAIPTDMPDSESPSTMASTITVFTTTPTLHDKGQVAGVVVIAASSSGGGLFLILILVLFVIILVFVSLKKCKTKTYNYSTNVVYSKRTTADEHLSTQIDDYEVVTDSNVAYEDTKLEVRMEENTAYELEVIPVSHNTAYVGVGRSQDETEKQDDYDYI